MCQRLSPRQNLPNLTRCLLQVLVVPRQAPQHPVYLIVYSKSYALFVPTVTPPKSQKATVEDVEDEDNIKTPQKKKKKKSKKKKSASSETIPASPPSAHSVDSTVSHETKTLSAPSSPSPQPSTAPKTSYTASYMSSMASLSLGDTTTAQSSHSYLQKENLIKSEKKIKSRPDHASLFSNADEKKGFFSTKFSSSKGEVKPKDSERSNWFSKLGKKTNGLMHQLLRPGDEQKKARAPMKWENFLKVSCRKHLSLFILIFHVCQLAHARNGFRLRS